MLIAGCTAENEPQQVSQQPVEVDFALTVAKSASQGTSGTTRMVSDYIKGTESNISLQCAIPFAVADPTVSEPVGASATYTSSPVGLFKQPRSNYAFFTSSCNFNSGTNAILAYATPKTTSSFFWEKGAVDATFNDYQPAHISFRLKTIQTKGDYLGAENVKTVPEQLADYLTAIANTSIGEGENIKTWKAYADPTSTTMNNDLKLLFKNFTNQLSDKVGEVLPGSSANIKVWVTELRKSLNAVTTGLSEDDAAIKTAIIAKIDEELDKLESTGEWKNFPATLHLPDGAAVVRWDGEKFVPETQTTTIADINNLDRLTYPAEICYYGNSVTWVSSEKLSDNFSTKNNWSDVLSGFTQGPVASNTKTVAMFDPLEYGVAQLKVQLQKTTSSTLEDSQKRDINVGSDKFKLTGIIVGGQLPVGFDFRPETLYPVYSENDMRFIYDSDVNTNGTDAPFYLSSTAIDTEKYIQTLVLQSYTGKSLKLVLEFENNSQDFKGNNGTVYKGTKFYLVGEVVPTIVDNPNEYQNRVFTKDHITTIAVTVSSLAKAYNVLPNLMSPRLEMGLELTPKWVQATTTDVIL